MVETRRLTRAQADSVNATPVDVRPGKAGRSQFAAYFLEEVRQYLEDKYGADRIYRDGLKVYTGSDPSAARGGGQHGDAYAPHREGAGLSRDDGAL